MSSLIRQIQTLEKRLLSGKKVRGYGGYVGLRMCVVGPMGQVPDDLKAVDNCPVMW